MLLNILSENNNSLTDGPLISIGIPTYNHPVSLRKTLESITRQTYKNLEIIVSDNCSPGPETETLVQEFCQKDNRIRYYRQEINKGLTYNWHFVLNNSTGKYFMWVADDDYWREDAVELLLNGLEKNVDCSVAMSAYEKILEKSNTTKIIYNLKSGMDINHTHPFLLALNASGNIEWHFLFYGLFRSDFLKRTIKNLPDVYGGDLLYVCEILMTTRILYIDEVMFFRKIHQKTTAELYPDEKTADQYGDPLCYVGLFFNFGSYLFRSPHIPVKRKIWIPFMLLIMGTLVTGIYAYRITRYFFRTVFKKNVP